MNVQRPVPAEMPRAVQRAVERAERPVWVLRAEPLVRNVTVIARSRAAQNIVAELAVIDRGQQHELDCVFGTDAARRVSATVEELATGRTAQTSVVKVTRPGTSDSRLIIRGLPAATGSATDTASIGVFWLELDQSREPPAAGNRIEFRCQRNATPTTDVPTKTEPSPLQRLARPEVTPQDRATLDDIAGIIQAAASAETKRPPNRLADSPGETVDGAKASQRDLRLLAHELRTPIGAIVTLAQILRERCEPGARHYLDDIEMCASHAVAVVDTALEPAAEDASGSTDTRAMGQSMRLEELDLAALASGVCKAMAPRASERSVSVRCYAHVGETVARSDGRALRQILFNLLSNAIKYNEERGQVVVTVDVDAAGHHAIVVSDTGRGMRRADLEQVRANASTSNGRYGLRIVDGLCRALGASLTIDSKPDIGTRVIVTLPASACLRMH